MTELAGTSAPAARDPYATVLEVGTTLAASLDLDEVVQTIARQVGEALDVQWCDINEWDPVARTLTYTAVWSEVLRGVDLDYLGTVVSLDDRPERDAVIRRGDLLETYVDDPDLDQREREVMLEYEEKAVMEMPLVFGGETLGILGVVESRRDRRFTDEEKELMRLLADPAATALGNARLYRRQQEQARRLAALLDASRALAASVDLDQVLAGVARLAVDVADVAYATVYEYRPHHDALVYRASHTVQPKPPHLTEDPLGTQYQLADCPGERRILESAGAVQEHLSDPDLLPDRRQFMEAWGQKSCLSLPLRAAGEARGILRLTVTDAEREFTAEELELVEAIAEVASAAIHNARLFRAQEEESERLLQLFEVSRRLSPSLDRGVVVSALQEGAGRLLAGEPRARVWLRGQDGLLARRRRRRRAGRRARLAGARRPARRRGGHARALAPRCARGRQGQRRGRARRRGGGLPPLLGGRARGPAGAGQPGGGRARERAPVPARRAGGDPRRPHRPVQPPALPGAAPPGVPPRPPVRHAAVAAHARPRRVQGVQRPVRPPDRRRGAARGRADPVRRHAPRRGPRRRGTAARSSP